MRTLLLFMLGALGQLSLAQDVTISGTITDESALPLPGVNVYVKGGTNGTQTDFNGNYEITAAIGQTLVYSYVGYLTVEHEVKKDVSEISITMQADNSTLQEVVVVGYAGKRQRSMQSASVSSVSPRSIKRTHLSNVLRGKASGEEPLNESYARIQSNIFKNTANAPLSTFSIDVDKAGYSNVRRLINNGQKIPKDAVKIEEMINYFSYDYANPKGDQPFSINTEVATSPWNKDALLVRIGLKGKDVDTKNTPASNLVFLLDVSGSMNDVNKLPLLKSSLEILVHQLREEDRVAIVVYAGAAGLVLPSTSGIEKESILKAINNLSAGGSTAGGEGIKLAYKIAQENFIEKGNNRIILATDGDFNVGASSDRAMEDLIVEQRKSGVFLTVLGFGMGNYKDSKMETLADKGNGNHAYIDNIQEARKVLGTEFFGTIYTIAKDVKIQVEFNPKKIQAYRLIGYENRLLNDEDFNDDTKDAGELGSGHTVTALYEIIPVGVKSPYVKKIDALKYSKKDELSDNSELLTVKFRYKEPDGDTSKLIEHSVLDKAVAFENASEDFKFSAAVALFGQQLRESVFIDTFKREDVVALAESGRGKDLEGYRSEFIRLVKSY